MSDKYYRGLKNIINDTKHKFQLATITLKINENKNSISGIKNDISEINNFSDKINDNETNISTNLSKINTNTSSISSNKDLITANTSDISDNLDKIDKNTSSISSISEFILKSDKDFEKTYNIEPQTFEFNKDNHFFIIFEKEIEHNFIKNTLLFVKNNIYYKYDDLSDDYHRCQHEYNIYDDENNLIHKYLFNKDTYYDENSNILNTTEEFSIYLKKNYNKIKIVLELHRHNRHGFGNINLEINNNNNNYIKVDYIEKGFLDNSHLINLNTRSISTNSGKIDANTRSISTNSGLINTNTSKITSNSSDISSNLSKINNNSSDISTNLININTNEDNIAYNLNEINYLKNNKSTQYLKNIYNILIYDSKTQISFKEEDIFYEKVFDVNANQNDFVEIFFKIQLEYRDTDDRHYVKSIYELFDENNNSLYIKSVNNNEYLYFSNKMTIDENIFYNFNKNIKKLKFVIKFQKLSSTRVIYLYYIKNENKRLILKHYGN